jgi:hypothetical protein
MNGLFNGDFSLCANVDCPQPPGACCLEGGVCVEVTEENCNSQGGIFNGDFSTCASTLCCITLDFQTDDLGNPMAARQRVNSELDGGPIYPVSISSSSYLGSVCGSVPNTAAIYNSSSANPGGQDPDLNVGTGNILILQLAENQNTCNPPGPDFYCTNNDDPDGGTLLFDFNVSVSPTSIDLIDVDNQPDEVVTITLTDSSGDTRTYTVPANWTGDLLIDGDGDRTLFLNTTAPQPGFAGTFATAVEDPGFDQDDVDFMTIDRGDDCPGNEGGSGAIDNLVWCQ